jgi:hypothetical protein
MNLKILDVKRFSLDTFFSPFVHELSGIVFIKDTLYCVDDDGNLYTFTLKIKNHTIATLQLQKKIPLRDKNGKVLRGDARDAEDLAYNHGDLFISFENKQRVVKYSLHGIALKNMKLHKDLRKKRNFQDSNKGLESVVYTHKYGIITAPEIPLKGSSQKYHTLYGKNQVWRLKAKGNITSLEKIDDDTLLVLLRKYSFGRGRYSALVRLHLNRCNKKRVCKSDVLAKFDSKKGWNIDNFEGVCKLYGNTYLMVSDDNKNPLQNTLFLLFEIIN